MRIKSIALTATSAVVLVASFIIMEQTLLSTYSLAGTDCIATSSYNQRCPDAERTIQHNQIVTRACIGLLVISLGGIGLGIFLMTKPMNRKPPAVRKPVY